MEVGLLNKLNFFLLFFLFSTNIYAVEFKGDFKQGSFILGKTTSDAKISIDNRNIRVSKNGYFAFGLDRDRNKDVIIKIKKTVIRKQLLKKSLKEYIRFKELMVCLQNK